MKIGELAKITDCPVETIRYYEKEGLLPEPARTAGNYRDYGEKHVERLRFIRNCRLLDMSHSEIRHLLELTLHQPEDCSQVNELLNEHINHVTVRIHELMRLKEQLDALQGLCQHTHSIESCGILQGLTDLEFDVPMHRHTHL